MVLVLMSVSGTGKTTIGKALVADLGWAFVEGDDFHPVANVEKTRAGIALNDEDRWPWLQALRRRIDEACERGEDVVLACSALKHDYREYLERHDPECVHYVYLHGPEELIRRQAFSHKFCRRRPTVNWPDVRLTLHRGRFGHKPAAVATGGLRPVPPVSFGGSAVLRAFSLMATALAVVAIVPFGQSAHAQHAEHFMKCAKVCADCQFQCDSCFKHCLTLTADGKKEYAKTAQLCADCAECCKTCSTLCARQSLLARPMLECCAKCCDECAAACEKFPDDKHMAACAKECRDCAKECRAMLKNLG